MNRLATETTWKVLTDERFNKLCAAADNGVLTYADLGSYELPDFVTKEEVWHLLELVRMQTSVDPLSSKLYQGKMEWIGTSSAIVSASSDLEFRCQTGSALNQSIFLLKDSPILSKNVEKSLQLALQIEGIDIDPDMLRGLFAADIAPKTPVERVASNFFKLWREVPVLAKREVSAGLIELLHYRLLEGVNADVISRRKDVNRYWSTTADPQDCIRYVCGNAQLRPEKKAFQPTMLRLLILTWIFFDFEVFPCLNALVGILVRNIVAHRWGYPLISWIPMGYLPFKESDASARLLYESVRNDFESNEASKGDLTNCVLMHLESWMHELDALESVCSRIPKLNEAIANLFKHSLNHRQRAILGAICKKPDMCVRIDDYKRKHGVAYSTARMDLFNLVEMGYLIQVKEGRAFTFQIDPAFKYRIAHLEDAVVGYLASI